MRICIAFFLIYIFSFSFLKADQKQSSHALKSNIATSAYLAKKVATFVSKNNETLKKELSTDFPDCLQHHVKYPRSSIYILFKPAFCLNELTKEGPLLFKDFLYFKYNFILSFLYPKHAFW